ncbi:hypothetical protein FS749_011489 [Ceratobasidium sp. UAMH 11750]|nr:hypothetical protein FS749_011489 [Ceratobasidium sp. UAMH 11750]
MSTISATRPTRFSRHFAYARPSLSDSKTRVNPLQYEDGPLVWIDLETTGLDPTRNRIIEVAVLITDGNLDLVDEEGCRFAVKSNKNIIDEMNDWCKMQHKISGLLTEVNEATHTAPEVADAVLEYIKRWVPLERAAHLAGSSVHFDAMFLRAIGPDVAEHGGQLIWNGVVDHLHYRIVDVSSVKASPVVLFASVWDNKIFTHAGTLQTHRAMDDIRQSIAELKFYRETIFVKSNT